VREVAEGEWRVAADLEWLDVARRLPAPFQRVLDVRSTPSRVEVTLARFVGVDAQDVLSGLERHGRVLPLDVWLGLALRWGEALRAIPKDSDGWGTPVDPMSLGFDVRGHLVCTLDAPNHVLGRWMREHPPYNVGVMRRFPQSLAPEHVRAVEVPESARVYSFAAALWMLLQGSTFYEEGGSTMSLLVDLAMKDLPLDPAPHPDCPPALVAELRQALSRAPELRVPTFGDFLEGLRRTAGVAPASDERVTAVMLGVAADEARRVFERAASEPSMLPRAWAAGGLAVLQDQAMERAVPLEQLARATVRRAPTKPRPPPPSPPPPPLPKFNLATPPPKKTGWRRFWPF
jgi:hypothetical protein